MSSQAQSDANRENARHSTGPISPDGKAASAQNARLHGFSSQSTVVPEEMQFAFAAFRDAWLSQLQPQGPIEEFLFRRIIHASWNLELIDETEAGLFTGPADMYLNEENEKRVARLARYRTMNMRLYNQAMRSFQYEQTQRGLRAAASPQIADLVAQTSPQANLPKIAEFAKRTQIREPFSTLSPEWQDQLRQMELHTDYINATLRQRKEDKKTAQADAA